MGHKDSRCCHFPHMCRQKRPHLRHSQNWCWCDLRRAMGAAVGVGQRECRKCCPGIGPSKLARHHQRPLARGQRMPLLLSPFPGQPTFGQKSGPRQWTIPQSNHSIGRAAAVVGEEMASHRKVVGKTMAYSIGLNRPARNRLRGMAKGYWHMGEAVDGTADCNLCADFENSMRRLVPGKVSWPKMPAPDWQNAGGMNIENMLTTTGKM